MQYVRLRFRTAEGRQRTIWAIKLKAGRYLVADKYGETEKTVGYDDEGREIARRELVVASQTDVISEKSARMNYKYAELEVVA